MPWSYDETDLSSEISQVRLEIGDIVEKTAWFTDEAIQLKLDSEGSVLLASAALLDILAARYAPRHDISDGKARYAASQVSKAFSDLATKLRAKAQTLGIVRQTRKDGYSQNTDNTEQQTAERGYRVYCGSELNDQLPL
jgi:ATP-dependent protease ClpP protease subunit